MLSRALTVAAFVLRLAGFVDACGSCAHPENDVTLTRYRPRMQPDAQSAISLPRGPLEWGQLNVLHTTDTHGWLEGHLKEQNYGADWGDWVSFVKRMNQTAQDAGVDLLVVDTGMLVRPSALIAGSHNSYRRPPRRRRPLRCHLN